MKAKICGITCLKDALLAEQYGAWAVGFNFYAESPRYIDIHKAKDIAAKLSDNILKIGLFIKSREEDIQHGLTFLDYAQIYQHYDETQIDRKRCIFSLHSGDHASMREHVALNGYAYILLDAPKMKDGLMGGTGRMADLKLARQLAQQYRLILAGGLNCRNVMTSAGQVKPYAVDVASGVERSAGVKDKVALKTFLMRCQHG